MFPLKPVKSIVPFAAGGAADLFARTLAAGMSTELGEQVIIEVHAGVAGRPGSCGREESAPDGYTLCLAGSAALSAIPFMVSRMPFYWQKDLAAADDRGARAGACGGHAGARDQESGGVCRASANPGKINFASAGTGSITDLAAESSKREAKIDIGHVPDRGIGPAITDMVGGHIQMLVGDVPSLVPMSSPAVSGHSR